MDNITCPHCRESILLFPDDDGKPQPVRPLLRLSEVEDDLSQLMKTIPSRNSLIKLVKDGTLEGTKTRLGWLVFKDSFDAWVENFTKQKLAA